MSKPLGGAAVLIVEDEIIIGMMLAAEVANAGAVPVGPVTTITGALKAIEDRPVDAVILDAKLMDGSGADLAICLDERRIPYVVVSGYDSDALPDNLRGAPFVAKPVSAPLLIEAINGLGITRRKRQLPVVRAASSADELRPA